MDPMTAASLNLLKHVEYKNVPLTWNHSQQKGVVFAYSGDDWELFSQAIFEAVNKVQEQRSERKPKGSIITARGQSP